MRNDLENAEGKIFEKVAFYLLYLFYWLLLLPFLFFTYVFYVHIIFHPNSVFVTSESVVRYYSGKIFGMKFCILLTANHPTWSISVFQVCFFFSFFRFFCTKWNAQNKALVIFMIFFFLFNKVKFFFLLNFQIIFFFSLFEKSFKCSLRS